MHADPKKSDDADLDEALRGTFPASDPVSPPSHIEDEMERRRTVLEEDVKKKKAELDRSQETHTEDLLDEALDETFPASDPVAIHAAVREAKRIVARKKAKRRAAKKKPAPKTKSKSKKKIKKKTRR